MGQQVAIVIELVATCACVATYTQVLASLPGHSVGVERRPGMDMNCLNMHNNCPHLCQTSHDLWEFHFYICLLSNRATALYAHTPVLPCDIHTPLHTLLFDAPSLCPPHGHPYKYNSLLPKQTAPPLIPAHPIPELSLPPVHVSFPTHFYIYPQIQPPYLWQESPLKFTSYHFRSCIPHCKTYLGFKYVSIM